jgi:lipoprotein signal peptidase
MKKIEKASVRLAMIGVIIGLMMTIVFHESPNVLAFIPVAGAIGGLIGTLIDRKKKN